MKFQVKQQARPAEAGGDSIIESVLGSRRLEMYTGNLISQLMDAVEETERRIFEMHGAQLEQSLERWYASVHQPKESWESKLAGVA